MTEYFANVWAMCAFITIQRRDDDIVCMTHTLFIDLPIYSVVHPYVINSIRGQTGD